MRMRQIPSSSTSRRSWAHIALISSSLLIPLLLFVVVAVRDRQLILRAAERDVSETADIFYEHARKVFETHELIAEAIDGRIRSMSWEEIAISRPLHDYLRELQERYPQVQGLWLVDSSGRLRNSSRVFPSPEVDLADRDYFTALRETDFGTFVSHSVKGRVFNEDNFNVVRRRSTKSDQFDGAIVVSVFPTYFRDFWRKTAPPLEMMAGLLRSDLNMLAREPASGSDNVPPSAAIAAAIKQGNAGSFRTVSAVDGIERLMAYRRIAPYDAFIVTGIGVNAVMAAWYNDLVTYGVFFGLAALALVLVSVKTYRRMLGERFATEQWRMAAHRLVEEADRRAAAEQQLHQAEKMEAIGQLTSGIAHDFNNLLTAIVGNIEPLQGRLGSPKDEGRIRAALAAAERGEKSLQSLLGFARREQLAVEAVDLDQLLQKTESLLRHALGSQSLIEIVRAPGTWAVAADANQLELAVLNLAINARDAMPDGGTLRIATVNASLDGRPNGLSGDFVAISISDTGVGMPPDVASRVFEPFYTTKEPGKGTGLGLSQVYGFATQCGGTVVVESAVARGTTVTIYLPKASPAVVQAKVASQRDTSAAQPDSGKRSVILVVEDEAAICHMVGETLRERGHVVIEAGSGDDALVIGG
jgi:two-component system, NtrC family, sensor kinase